VGAGSWEQVVLDLVVEADEENDMILWGLEFRVVSELVDPSLVLLVTTAADVRRQEHEREDVPTPAQPRVGRTP